MDTSTLITRLAGDLPPVAPLPPPSRRLGWWLAVSLPAVLLVAWLFGLRDDLPARLSDPRFLAEEGAALATALLAAHAALSAGLPDRPGWQIALPAAPFALWLAMLGAQCADLALHAGPGGLTLAADAMCLPAIAAGGAMPAAAITVLLHRGGRFRAVQAALCAGLAAAALGAAALRLYHTEDAALMVLVWQLGSVVLLSLAAAGLGRILLRPA